MANNTCYMNLTVGRKTSDLVHQVYDLLVAHFNQKENFVKPASKPDAVVKVEPIIPKVTQFN